MTTEARQLDPSVETWALEYPGALSMAAVDVIREQLQEALPGKRVVIVQEGGRFRALDYLDAALADAEAVLPDGWVLGLQRGWWGYFASAGPTADVTEAATHTEATAAGALRALAAMLRAVPA